MKCRLCIFLALFFVMACGFSEATLFSLVGLNQFINIETLESISDSWYFSSFEKESKCNLQKVVIKLQRKERKENYTLFYNSKGLLDKEESSVFEDYVFLYQYDEKDRLLSRGDFTFKYLDDFQRERYCRGVLQYKESLEYQKNKIIVTIISYSERYADGAIIESGKEIYEYSFIAGLLTDICCTRFNGKGIEKKNKHYLKLSYDNNRLKSTAEYYGEELRCERIFEYQNERLVKQTVSYTNDPAANHVAEYFDFDKHGNFQHYIEKSARGIEVSLSREIVYKY